MGIKVEVAGEAISLRPGQSFSWALSYGVNPSTSTLETIPEVVEAIRKKSIYQGSGFRGQTTTRDEQPIDIVFEDTEANRRVEIKNVYVVTGNRPGKDFNTASITLADQRWLWDRVHIERSYNIRRRNGDFRLVGGKKTPIQLRRRVADYEYRRHTLYEKGRGEARPWKAKEVLEDVLSELVGLNNFIFDYEGGFLEDSIEGIELNDRGPEALARVLTYIPGAAVYIGGDGKCHIANLYDNSELLVFNTYGEGSSGDYRLVDRSNQRPEKGFYVLSDRQVELRFDYIEEKGDTPFTVPRTGTASGPLDDSNTGPGNEPLWLQNVIINPLYNLPKLGQTDIPGQPVETYTQGEPIPVKTFLEVVGLNHAQKWDRFYFTPMFPGFELDAKTIRERWVSPANWKTVELEYASSELGQLSRERMLILQALRNDWRQTYQILPQWRDRIRTLENSRVAIVNFETGSRAPAPVYCQHMNVPSVLGHYAYAGTKPIFEHDDWAEDLSEKDISPFVISVIDSDMGLFRIVNREHQMGIHSYSVIGIASPDTKVPIPDMANVNVFTRLIDLDPDFKLAVIMTTTQDSPNDRRRLHHEFVSTEEARMKLSGTFTENSNPQIGISDFGPDIDVYQTAEAALIGWSDEYGEQIRQAFLGRPREVVLPEEARRNPYPDEVFLNQDRIRELSVAAAASQLGPLMDRVEGQVTGPMRPVNPTGNLRTVVHQVAVGRENRTSLLTTIIAPGEVPTVNMYSLLPEGVRRKVRRLVE